MKTYKYRDLTIIELPHTLLISACDSSGGVGEKPDDHLSVPTKYVSMFALRVCLFELLACGAEVITISDAVSGEMEPTGQALIAGITEELALADLSTLPVNGSTEENFKTTMTAFGIFVLGTADTLRITPSEPGDMVICIGKPKFGASLVYEGDAEIADYHDLRTLIATAEVKEIIPCGSKGILYEANNLALIHKCQFEPLPNRLDLTQSCGPATVVIASVTPQILPDLLLHFKEKLTVIGTLKTSASEYKQHPLK